MKKNLTLLLTLLIISAKATFATVLTVSNSPISGGQYTNITDAVTAATTDDTIYIQGTGVSYGNATINKRLVVMGAGYNVTGTQFNMSTICGTLTVDSSNFTGPISGLQILGINGDITFNIALNNVHIARCHGGINYVRGNNWIVENNIIASMYFYTNTISSFIIRNNVINGAISSAYNPVNASGLLIDHNIITGALHYLTYAVITNNVFHFSGVTSSGGNNYNTYNNNICINTTPESLPFGTNSGSGNFNNPLPSQVFVTSLTSSMTYPTLLGYDLHLSSSSPGKNSATDGTDVGIYGGVMSFPNMTGATTLPQMTMLNILNSSLPQGGTLNYEFKARKQN